MPWNAVDTGTPAAAIPSEQRTAGEVLGSGAGGTSPETAVRDPAFDVAPAALITGIITERGALHAPSGPAVAELAR